MAVDDSASSTIVGDKMGVLLPIVTWGLDASYRCAAT